MPDGNACLRVPRCCLVPPARREFKPPSDTKWSRFTSTYTFMGIQQLVTSQVTGIGGSTRLESGWPGPRNVAWLGWQFAPQGRPKPHTQRRA